MLNAVRTQFATYDRKIFWTIALFGACALFAYIYFVSISVFAVIGRKEAELKAGRVGASVAALESEYAALDRSIDLAMAHVKGFRDVAEPRYVHREAERETFSLRGGTIER